MEIKHNGKDIELSFGFKFMNDVDKKLGMEMEQMSIGQGIQMLVPNLQDGNPVAIGHTILLQLLNKKALKSDEESQQYCTKSLTNKVFDEFAEQVITELGKRPMTRKPRTGRIQRSEESQEIEKQPPYTYDRVIVLC